MPLQTQLCMHAVSLDHASLLIFAPVWANLRLLFPRPVFVLNPVCRTKIFRIAQGWCICFFSSFLAVQGFEICWELETKDALWSTGSYHLHSTGYYWCHRALNLFWGKNFQQPVHVCMSSIFLCFDLDVNAEDVAVHCLNLNPTLHHLLVSKSTIKYTICQDVSDISNDQDKEWRELQSTWCQDHPFCFECVTIIWQQELRILQRRYLYHCFLLIFLSMLSIARFAAWGKAIDCTCVSSSD